MSFTCAAANVWPFESFTEFARGHCSAPTIEILAPPPIKLDLKKHSCSAPAPTAATQIDVIETSEPASA
jgi:hypothetical protein